jgi:hypothetical protein
MEQIGTMAPNKLFD